MDIFTQTFHAQLLLVLAEVWFLGTAGLALLAFAYRQLRGR